jgi:hypothetical protein
MKIENVKLKIGTLLACRGSRDRDRDDMKHVVKGSIGIGSVG